MPIKIILSTMATPVSIDPPPYGQRGTGSEEEDNLEAKVNNHQRNDDDETRPLTNSSEDVSFNATVSSFSDQQQDVGKGTIVFSDKLRGSTHVTVNSRRSSAELDGAIPSQSSYVPYQQQPQQQQQRHLSPKLQQYESHAPTTTVAGLLPQQIYAGYGSVQDQSHEFHYSNPDYHFDDDGIDGNRRHRDDVDENCCLVRMCSCFYRPIINVLSQENLNRSFCYGAIDGLLTGTGIISSFWGLGLLSVRSRIEVRIGIVAFTVAACIADSLCMAMGHVWTTFVVSSNHVQERSYERHLLERDKADSKGKLVDLLLSKGMLKIDAMSLADTLEGYPDLFISALVGDSLLSSGIQDAILDEDNSANAIESPNYNDRSAPLVNNNLVGLFGSFGTWNTGRGDRDPEWDHLRIVLSESQKEGICMMIGFTMFAIIPSLLWLFLPLWFQTSMVVQQNELHVNYNVTLLSSSSSSTSLSDINDGESVSVPSLIILILTIIVWCLGVWKSYFVDSNWVVFGIETVVVLMVCVCSAYSVAALSVHFLLNGSI